MSCQVEVFYTFGERPIAVCALVKYRIGASLIRESALAIDEELLQSGCPVEAVLDFIWDEGSGIVRSPIYHGVRFARSGKELECTAAGRELLRTSGRPMIT